MSDWNHESIFGLRCSGASSQNVHKRLGTGSRAVELCKARGESSGGSQRAALLFGENGARATKKSMCELESNLALACRVWRSWNRCSEKSPSNFSVGSMKRGLPSARGRKIRRPIAGAGTDAGSRASHQVGSAVTSATNRWGDQNAAAVHIVCLAPPRALHEGHQERYHPTTA